jgi:DNA-binding NarL/FixJ family response regulator
MRVLLADDHNAVRRALAVLLEEEADIEVVGEAVNGQMAVDLTRQLSPDVVLMDVNMPILNGIQAMRIIRAVSPTVRVIALSGSDTVERRSEILAAGAVWYIRKTEVEVLLAAIRACQRELPPQVAA